MKKKIKLNGKTWLRYSISIWDDISKTEEERGINHPAMFPVALPRRLIEIYSLAEGEVVLDPFMGTGSTLVAAQQTGRIGMGFEIVPEFVEVCKKRLQQTQLYHQTPRCKIYLEDARKLLNYLGAEQVDLCITSPPYWDILSRERTADRKKSEKYSELKEDLGNITDYQTFLEELGKVFFDVFFALKQGRHCVVVVMDLRKKDRFYPYHIDIINLLQKLSFKLEDIIIWDRGKEYSNLRPLGYPYKFIVNKIHEYVLVFRKPVFGR